MVADVEEGLAEAIALTDLHSAKVVRPSGARGGRRDRRHRRCGPDQWRRDVGPPVPTSAYLPLLDHEHLRGVRLGLVIIAATNRPEILDRALLRAGRFDRQVLVDRPDMRGREAILRVHARKVRLGADVKLPVIAQRTPGMVGADLANVVKEAALASVRRGSDKVDAQDFEEALDRLQLGLKKEGRVMTEDEKRRVATHEAGHALVARSMKHGCIASPSSLGRRRLLGHDADVRERMATCAGVRVTGTRRRWRSIQNVSRTSLRPGPELLCRRRAEGRLEIVRELGAGEELVVGLVVDDLDGRLREHLRSQLLGPPFDAEPGVQLRDAGVDRRSRRCELRGLSSSEFIASER